MQYQNTYIELSTEIHSIILEIYKATSKFPQFEILGITSQFRRSAVSVAANFAEGYRKTSLKDKLRLYNIALCSLAECRYFSLLSRDLHYVTDDIIERRLENFERRFYNYCKAIERKV